jgi:hypothetical protein
MPKGIPNKKVEIQGVEYATVDDLKKLAEGQNKLLELVESLAQSKKEPEKKDVAAPMAPKDNPVPPKWNILIDNYVGKDVGRWVDFDDRTGRTKLFLSIPLERSNAPKDYIDFYKSDIRSTVLGEGGREIEDWLKLVQRNLKVPRK